jgi:hypothetical protein
MAAADLPYAHAKSSDAQPSDAQPSDAKPPANPNAPLSGYGNLNPA